MSDLPKTVEEYTQALLDSWKAGHQTGVQEEHQRCVQVVKQFVLTGHASSACLSAVTGKVKGKKK